MNQSLLKWASVLTVSLIAASAGAKTYDVNGYKITLSDNRSDLTYEINGQSYDHSGEIKLESSPMFRATPGLTQEKSLYVVQYRTKLLPFYKEQLSEMGITTIRFAPDHALLIQATEEQVAKLQQLPLVHQVVEYSGAHKMAGISNTHWIGPREFSQNFYDILTTSEADRKSLLKDLKTQFVLKHQGESTHAITILADIHQIEKVAQRSEVVWVEEAPEAIELDMDIVLITGGAKSLEQKSGKVYQGEGIRGHVLEGIYRDHQDFVADDFREKPIAIRDGAVNSHGQATYGIIFGAGYGDASARGLMPRAQGYYTNNSYVFNNDNRYSLTEELINEHQVMLQTASWGYPTTTRYTSRSLEMDRIIFDLDFVVTQSQSNRGNRNSRPQAWAKNIVSVGGVSHKDNTDFSDDSWKGGGASIGPASDGRIKPDIVSYYDRIHTTGPSTYRQFGGTSGATPVVNGHLGLIIELFTDGVFGNELAAPIENRFANRPHAATAKALLINSARQYDFEGSKHDLTRVHQGWGHPDLNKLFESRENILVVNESDLLEVLETREYTITVGAETPELAVTMVYNDPPGLVGAFYHRVNDLDLELISPNGEVYYGNYGLYEGTHSPVGGEKDSINTVENVFVNAPVAGEWTVRVHAAEINSDGHVETEDLDADFALVARGIL